MATSLLTKNLHDMTEQISPLRMRSRHGLERVKVFALPLVAGAAELPLPCMVNVLVGRVVLESLYSVSFAR